MTYFLVIASDYERVSFALYQGQKQIELYSDHKHTISKNLIVLLDKLLSAHDLTISDMKFIAVNQGPGPFTTLRTIIASVNGISFAIHIPLIGVNSLVALLKENTCADWPITIALFNAFNNDVYFGIACEQNIEIGYENIELFLTKLKKQFLGQPIRFIGSGVELYKKELHKILGSQAVIPEDNPLHASTGQIAKMALIKWHEQKDLSYQLQPIYLKEQKFKKVNN